MKRIGGWVVLGLAAIGLIQGNATAASKKTPAATAKPAKGVATKGVSPDPAAEPPPILPSSGALRVANWIAASGDNRGLPYLIVDKPNAALFLFDPSGTQLAAEPVLLGIAPGDDSTPGVGAKKLSQIGTAEKTTPAGRFLAKFGLAFGKERMLWVDYANSVGMHPIPADVGPKERRRERMLSPTPDDNRITFGCINVPRVFYAKQLAPMFQRKGGYVYVMPDTKPLEEVFPQLLIPSLNRPVAG